MKKTPLYDALMAHKNLNRSSFHTPGHKNSKKIMNKRLFNLDFTELPDTDSLYEASGAIKEAESRMAQLYSAKSTIFSAGGCTLCIQTMLKLALPYGGKVLASRMIHKSAVNTMAILDAKVEWIMPQIGKNMSGFSQVSASEIGAMLQKNENFDCVYITSPDYFGRVADVESIAKICHKFNVPLLVDNAHGSHFKFLSRDIHPITLGADFVADSVHKTLPVMTGGALLHILNEKYVQNAKAAMSIFGSTSPSYQIMASLDVCGAWLSKSGKNAYLKLENDVAKIKKIAKQKGILDNCENVDPVRLALNTAKIGISGDDAARYFRQNGVEPELSDKERVVFIATPMNSKKDFFRLMKAIKTLPIGEIAQKQAVAFGAPIIKKSLHEALFSSSESIKTRNSLGKISANTVCSCPPGIPILLPGEIVTENSIKNLLYYGILSIDVIK